MSGLNQRHQPFISWGIISDLENSRWKDLWCYFLSESDTLVLVFFLPFLCSGPVWWKAWPFRLSGPAYSPQCHPQAHTGEKSRWGRPQRRLRLRHQLLGDGPWQPGQHPALTPCTVRHSKPRTTKTKALFCLFCLQRRNIITAEIKTPALQALVSPGPRMGIRRCRKRTVDFGQNLSSIHSSNAGGFGLERSDCATFVANQLSVWFCPNAQKILRPTNHCCSWIQRVISWLKCSRHR